MSHRRRIILRTLGTATASALVAVGFALTPLSANASNEGDGWLRLGHLSTQTKSVDVRVTAPGAGEPVLQLANVAYGDVSPYASLASGAYTVSMVPAGSPVTTAPVISSDVQISADGATTVIAYGPSSDLEVKALQDDLTEPTAGNARIRLMQASSITPTVDVQTSTGLSIARNARAGSVTDYAEVPAGHWTLNLSGAAVTGSTDIDVAAGSVVTLFVLDTADGNLTIRPIVDSSGVGMTPEGGVATGAGGTAPDLFGVRTTSSPAEPGNTW